MKPILRILLVLFSVGMIFAGGAREARAAGSPIEFAIPVETKRTVDAIALIHRDDTAKLLPVEGNLKRATVNPSGGKIAYVIRDGDHLKVYLCDPNGQNKKLAEDYKSEERNFQDFVDIRFIKGGRILLIARFLKNEISFIEYDMQKGKPRFINKLEWQGPPTSTYRIDSYNGGTLVYAKNSNQGSHILQQVWMVGAYAGKFALFLELEAPPSILDMVPDLKNKRIFASGTATRHLSAKNTIKNLMLVDSIKKQPKNLTDDPLFLNMTMSDDGNSIAWVSSTYQNGIKFKRYKINSGKVVEIVPEGQKARDKGQASVGSIVPSQPADSKGK